MLLNSIVMVEAEFLLAGMGRKELSDQFLADLDSSGKRELFEQAVQILIADAKAVQEPNDLFVLTQNIYRLADGTPELKKYLFGHAPDGQDADFTDETKIAVAASEAEKKKSREIAAGIEQHLLVLVDEDENLLPPNERKSVFQKLLAKLGRLKG